MKLPEGFEAARWGGSRVLSRRTGDNGLQALTNEIIMEAGCSMSYQMHRLRDEIWTFAGGEGKVVFEGSERIVRPGDVLVLPKGALHAVKAHTDLYFVEVQLGEVLDENDIERFEWTWGTL